MLPQRSLSFRCNSSRPTGNHVGVPSTAQSIVTDDAVPQAHVGLHSFLYGEGGAETAHGTEGMYAFREGEDDGSTLIPTEAYLAARDGDRPVGVYAMYDTRRNLQYVSYSRNVVLAIRALRSRVDEDRCAYVRVMVFANKAMQSRAALEKEAANWLDEAGTLPPGNGAEQDVWEGPQAFDPGHMSADEQAAYEEKKLKMRKAMGEKVQIEEGNGAVEGDEHRRMLRAAVEADDWSAVIDQQTSETIDENDLSSSNGGSNQGSQGLVVTPFARASVHRSIGNIETATSKGFSESGALMMTIETVDKALDDVRPYLIADGGNVEVVSVANGIVALELQGACGSCPSANATMKMGIERCLHAAFPDQLLEVVSVGGPVDTSVSVEAVDMHLNMLRGAIAAYGGGVDVISVEGGTATLRYAGPKPIGYGIVAAVKDKFPDVRTVIMLDAESGEPISF